MQAGPLHWKKNTTECFILGWHLQNAAPCLVLYPSPSTPTAAGFQEQEIPSDLAEEGPKECEVKSQSPKEVKLQHCTAPQTLQGTCNHQQIASLRVWLYEAT